MLFVLLIHLYLYFWPNDWEKGRPRFKKTKGRAGKPPTPQVRELTLHN